MKAFPRELMKNLNALSGNKAFMMRLLSLTQGQVFPFAVLYQVGLDTRQPAEKMSGFTVAGDPVVVERSG